MAAMFATEAAVATTAATAATAAGTTAAVTGTELFLAELTATTVASTTAATGATPFFLAGAGGAAGSVAAPGLMATLGMTTGDLILGGMSGFSAISSIASGAAAKNAAMEGAMFEGIAAKQELLKGRREALQIAEQEQEALEQNMVNVAASGITGQGSPKAAQEAIIKKADFETSITRTNAELNAQARTVKGKQLELEGDAAFTGGVSDAAGTVAGFFLRRGRRGIN